MSVPTPAKIDNCKLGARLTRCADVASHLSPGDRPMSNLANVFSPIRIAGVTLKNRVVHPAVSMIMDGSGSITDRFIAFHESRARGGAALSILEIAPVHPSTPAGLQFWSGDLVPGYRRLMAAVRPHDMRVFQQLWYGGFNSAFGGALLDAPAPMSVSAVPGYSPLPGQSGVVASEMTQADIRMIVDGFAAGAARARDGGLDGVEIHGGHGYAVAQFMSPLWNEREDDYGGSFEHRLRFPIELLSAVRREVGRDFPVGIRLSPDLSPGGMTASYLERIIAELEARELIDYVNISSGGYLAFDRMYAGMEEPAGYQLPNSRIAGAATRKPRLVLGSFTTLEQAEAVIAAGTAEMVGFARQFLADPQLVAKTAAGRAAQVRPCIQCNQGCTGAQLGPYHRLGCTVNASAGYAAPGDEHALVPAETPRRCLVIGGGPAGLEAARVAATRGHQVVVIERSHQLGGQLRLAARAPRRERFLAILAWLEAEIARLGVELRLGIAADAAAIAAEQPDVVVVAAGSTPRKDGYIACRPGLKIAGADKPHVLAPRDLFVEGAARRKIGSALVYDDVGHYEAAAAAEHLQAMGAHVTFVTQQASFLSLMESAQVASPTLARLRSGAFDLITRAAPLAIGDAACEVDLFGSGRSITVAADVVVLATHPRPNRDLARDLAGRAIEVHLVGDALTTRHLDGAIASGYSVAARI